MKSNPFLISGYVSPDLFCDRENELQTLTKALINNVNVTLVSPRRMGKTGLILRLFDELQMQRKTKTVYVDIFATRSLDEFIKTFVEAVFSKFGEATTIGKRFMNFLRGLRPVFSFDTISGAPQIQIAYQTEGEKEQTLHNIFAFLESQKTFIVVAFDEFQQISEYPEKATEALLRTEIQQLHNLSFIFCGSKRSLMVDMFSNAKRPFYASTQFVNLEEINAEKYAEFIMRLFNKNGMKISVEAIDFILSWTNIHTYYTQYLCNMVFAQGLKKIDIDDVKSVCAAIIAQSDVQFLQLRQLLTSAQWNYLIALAKEKTVLQITAQRFLLQYKIGTAANSKRLIRALCDKDLVLETITENGVTYRVYDMFLMRWLQEKY